MKTQAQVKQEMNLLKAQWMGPSAQKGKRNAAAFSAWKALRWTVAQRDERPSTNVPKLEV